LSTGHPHRSEGSFSRGDSIPYRVPDCLLTVRPVGRIRLPRFLASSTASLGSPRMRQGVKPTSVPLSGFLNLSAVSKQTRVSWPYFMPQPFLRFLLQSFPLTTGVCPSRDPRLLCGYPPAFRNATPGFLSPPVSPTPALSHSCLDPRTTMDSLSRSRPTLQRTEVRLHAFKNPSRSSWIPSDGTEPFRQLHPFRSLLPPASPFTPTRVAPSQRPILSWTSASLELSPSTPRILYPSWTTRIQARFEDSDVPPDPSPSSEDSGSRPDVRSVDPVTRLEGSCNPSSQVSPSQYEKHSDKLVGGFQPCGDRTAPSRRRRSYFPGLGAPGKPDSPDLRSLEVREKWRFSEEIACSFEVSRLFSDLVTVKLSPTRAYRFASSLGHPSPAARDSLWVFEGSSRRVTTSLF
jgi:hypothetical protein